MKVDLSKAESKPGEEINITVKANPNSFVGLLGVDQSMMLLKSGNDIAKSAVVDSMERYGDIDHHNSHEHRATYSDFVASRAVLITNAKINKVDGELKGFCLS